LQEVNLKYFIVSIYFTYVSLSAVTFFVGISSLRVCGVLIWLGGDRKSSYYTHTQISKLDHQFFSSHHNTSHLTHSEKLHLHKRHLTILNSWMLDNRMLGGQVSGVTPLVRLENLSCPHISFDGPAFSL
jgi:hypothetical protein